MKKLIAICSLIIFTVSGNAQINGKTDIGSLNQEQLNLALEKANGRIRVGATLTGVGAAAGITGFVMYSNYDLSLGDMISGFLAMVGGIGLISAGIPIWITGSVRKSKIETELVKYSNARSFYEGNSAPVYGIGIKIKF